MEIYAIIEKDCVWKQYQNRQGKKERKQVNKKQTPKVKKTWDVLIPLMLIICVMPLLIRLAVYSCGYSGYDWYSANDLLADFYNYYKSYFLVIVAFFAVIILVFKFALYRERMITVKPFIPAFVYCGFVILSTVFSVNPKASLEGNFESFESCFVLISYVVMAVYAYQMMESEYEYRVIKKCIIGSTIVFALIGIMQVFGYDVLDFTWVQRLIMSAEEFELYGGEIENIFSSGTVYLTLYNPNYAGITLCMLFSIVFFLFLSRKGREKILYGVLAVLLTVLVFFTYARASLLILIMVGAAMLCVDGVRKLKVSKEGEKQKQALMNIVSITVGCVVVFLGLLVIDGMNGNKVLSSFTNEDIREPLEKMVTNEEGLHITYDGVSYRIYIENNKLYCLTETTKDKLVASKGEELSIPMEEGAKVVLLDEETNEFMLYICETTAKFQKEGDNYFYKSPSGNLTTMAETEAVDLHGLESFASARGYIWSRVMPLLDKYLVVGSGPDTFAEVFPQDDYTGKIVYADMPERVIEKAHNDYLTKWVQTGLLSLVCLLVFYGYITLYCGKMLLTSYMNVQNISISLSLGIGCYFASLCYMMAGLMNDSTLQTSPLFYVLIGITIKSAWMQCE